MKNQNEKENSFLDKNLFYNFCINFGRFSILKNKEKDSFQSCCRESEHEFPGFSSEHKRIPRGLK